MSWADFGVAELRLYGHDAKGLERRGSCDRARGVEADGWLPLRIRTVW